MAAPAVQPPTITPKTPPTAPNPSEDTGLIPQIGANVDTASIPSPPISTQAWDAGTMSAEVAMKMLCRSLETLAAYAGDVPPTPALQRAGTPRLKVQNPSPLGPQPVQQPTSAPHTPPSRPMNASLFTPVRRGHMRTSSRPATPVPDTDIKAPDFFKVDVGSPEASFHEPAAACSPASEDGPSTPQIPRNIQQEAIARKFFSKAPPPVSLEEYMVRLQRYCPMSTAVYLAAGAYIYRVSIEDAIVPITTRTIHRLVLGSLRVAMKALEDLRYPQQRFAGVGGVKESELRLLEISLCYLTDFELQVDNDMLYRKMTALQQSAIQAGLMQSKSNDVANMRLKLPMRARVGLAQHGHQTAAMTAG